MQAFVRSNIFFCVCSVVQINVIDFAIDYYTYIKYTCFKQKINVIKR